MSRESPKRDKVRLEDLEWLFVYRIDPKPSAPAPTLTAFSHGRLTTGLGRGGSQPNTVGVIGAVCGHYALGQEG